MNGAALKAGAMIDRYELIKPLGAGGMGAVYLVKHPTIKGAHCALKLQHVSPSTHPSISARFKREAELLAHINHRNVVKVTDAGSHGDAEFLVMELLKGESLRERLDRSPEKRLELTESLALLLPTMTGALVCHRSGVVHRDIKPDNIFLAQEGIEGTIVPKLIDFGIAKADGAERGGARTETGVGMGTPAYMAPEQYDAKTVDHRADQYALGIVLYECLTGVCPPYPQIAMERYDPPSKVVGTIPPEVDDVIAKMLRVSPAERFPDLKDVIVALAAQADESTRHEVLSQLKTSVPSVAPAREARPQRAQPRRNMLAAAVIVVATGAAIFGATRLGSSKATLPPSPPTEREPPKPPPAPPVVAPAAPPPATVPPPPPPARERRRASPRPAAPAAPPVAPSATPPAVPEAPSKTDRLKGLLQSDS